MKVKVMCHLGDLPVEMPVEEAQAVFERFTGKRNDLPESVMARMGDGLRTIPGVDKGVRLNYAVVRLPDHAVIKRFSDLKPEDDFMLMPPVMGG